VTTPVEDVDLEIALRRLKLHDPERYAKIAVLVAGMVATYEGQLEPREIHEARLAFARAGSRGQS
jgi:hypothetical protein